MQKVEDNLILKLIFRFLIFKKFEKSGRLFSFLCVSYIETLEIEVFLVQRKGEKCVVFVLYHLQMYMRGGNLLQGK